MNSESTLVKVTDPSTIKIGYDRENDTLILDGSTYAKWQSCRRHGIFKTALKRRPVGKTAALDFGSALHEMEHAYRSTGTADVMAIAERYNLVNTDDHRNVVMLQFFYDEIQKRYPFGNDYRTIVADNGTPVLEGPFLLPLSNDGTILWAGRIDRAILFPDGSPAILDHKTSSEDSAQFWGQFDFDCSQYGYVWALQTLLGRPVDRFCIRAYFTRKSHVNKEAIRDQTYIVDPRRLAEWHSNLVIRCRSIKNTLEWLAKTQPSEYLTEVLRPAHSNWHACFAHKYGACPFTKVCLQPDLTSQATVLFSGQYELDEWSPFNTI